MFKKLILLMSLFSSVFAYAGHETGNGGDSHLSRYLLAQHIAKVTMKRVNSTKLEKIFTNKAMLKIVKENISDWPASIASMKFEVSEKMLYEEGVEKAALNVKNSNVVKISKAYFEKYNLSLDEVIINVIHESGHKLGLNNHNQLDRIGTIFVNGVYKYFTQENSWQKYLRIDRSIQSALDTRLREVATEYLLNGDGIYLAKTLYFFTRFNLRDSNLSQMFKYLTLAKLQLDIKKWFPSDSKDYWEFHDRTINRMAKELILFSRKISKEQSIALVKYGMAKLKANGLLYTENIYEFDMLAKDLNSILLNKNISTEDSVLLLKKSIKDNFYMWL